MYRFKYYDCLIYAIIEYNHDVKLNEIFSLYMTEWGLYFDIVPLVIHTLLPAKSSTVDWMSAYKLCSLLSYFTLEH